MLLSTSLFLQMVCSEHPSLKGPPQAFMKPNCGCRRYLVSPSRSPHHFQRRSYTQERTPMVHWFCAGSMHLQVLLSPSSYMGMLGQGQWRFLPTGSGLHMMLIPLTLARLRGDCWGMLIGRPAVCLEPFPLSPRAHTHTSMVSRSYRNESHHRRDHKMKT